jgi:malate dehydrogenase (oxaloacetate-decarboxylating)(NADP+)
VGITLAREGMRNRSTLIAAMLLRRGDVDAMLCGTSGAFAEHLNYVRQVIGLREGVRTLGTMNMVILGGRPLFMCDTYVNFDPSPEQLAELTQLAAEEVRRFGLVPSVALLSHSSFGSADSPSARCESGKTRSSTRFDSAASACISPSTARSGACN